MPYRSFSSGIGTVSYPLPSFQTAMETLRPGATFEMYNDTIINWNDPSGQEPPTLDEISEELNRENEVYNQYAWERDRKDTFPSIESQLDTLYHDIENGKFGEDAKTGAWYVGISSIKTSYPKS
jgi:hypothetical protein